MSAPTSSDLWQLLADAEAVRSAWESTARRSADATLNDHAGQMDLLTTATAPVDPAEVEAARLAWRASWRIGITQPGAMLELYREQDEAEGIGWRETIDRYVDGAPERACVLTCLDADFRPERDLMRRGGCLRCGWAGPERTSENEAVEDAHDHAFPDVDWRHLPSVSIKSLGDNPKPDKLDAWRATTIDKHDYPADWADRLGPIWTARTPPGTRHVPLRSPFGGYDLGRVLA